MAVVTIVTGLPRSGTSLMMQILEKSSLEILSDGIRQKDNNNPEGYYELEAVKGIVKDNSFLKSANGKVLKVVAPLPMFLDKSLSYRVIFMRRDIQEILRSQEIMLNKDQQAEREKFTAIYTTHLQKTYQFFELNNIPFLDVFYKELVNNPESELKKIIEFLGLHSDWKELAKVVNPELYRNKA
ncbi:MAG: sulfotransferase [Crocinitomicaceae bacterium]|nr:sulfotransferase [Crocinitomicaceae bacterium]MCF8410713.1 sulfotransferase [Crocinitomicaceae bacterium]